MIASELVYVFSLATAVSSHFCGLLMILSRDISLLRKYNKITVVALAIHVFCSIKLGAIL